MGSFFLLEGELQSKICPLYGSVGKHSRLDQVSIISFPVGSYKKARDIENKIRVSFQSFCSK